MSESIIERAQAYLRGHTTGELRFDEHVRPVKYVLTSEGRLASPVMVVMIESLDSVLAIPEDAEGAMEVQVTLVPFEEKGGDAAVADRWRIYHGEPDDVRWAWLDIDSARFEGHIIDGEALMVANPLATEEAKICREINQQHRDDLARLCEHVRGFDVKEPLMVGLDPLGIDVRGRFQVVRVLASERMESGEQAREVIHSMIEEAKSASD